MGDWSSTGVVNRRCGRARDRFICADGLLSGGFIGTINPPDTVLGRVVGRRENWLRRQVIVGR